MKLKRFLACCVAGVLMLGFTVFADQAGAVSSNYTPPPSCGSVPQHLDNASVVLPRTTLLNGPFSYCKVSWSTYDQHPAQYFCSIQGNDGQQWTYMQDNYGGTGWAPASALPNGGSTVVCGAGSLTQIQCGPGTQITCVQSPTNCGMLTAGQGLWIGQNLYSCDYRFDMYLQTDGNLVQQYANGSALWNAKIAGNASTELIMQSDGNLVVYTSNGSVLWASNTSGNSGATFSEQNDGNSVIYSSSGRVLWRTNTCCH